MKGETIFLEDEKIMMEKLKLLIPADLYHDTLDPSCSAFLRVSCTIFPLLPKEFLDMYATEIKGFNFDRVLKHILPISCKTDLKNLVVRKIQLHQNLKSLVPLGQDTCNKDAYILQQIATENNSYDISTGKLWCAIVLLKKSNYNSALSILNQVLSNIPPFALYEYAVDDFEECLYADKFMDSSSTAMQRAKQAWLTDIVFPKCMAEILPLGIQIELFFTSYIHSMYISLSPYTCVHYLIFLCYHGLGQF